MILLAAIFVGYFTGNMPVSKFVALCVFALIGATIKLLIHVSKRDKESEATPEEFSIVFMLRDNWKRMFSSGLLIYLFIRFAPQLFPESVYDAVSDDIEFLTAALIGFSFDLLSEWLKDKVGFLRVNRDKIYKKEE